MSRVSETEIKRWALDASDWLWGTAQGAFNEKQTTSQIIVDAVISRSFAVVISMLSECAWMSIFPEAAISLMPI